MMRKTRHQIKRAKTKKRVMKWILISISIILFTIIGYGSYVYIKMTEVFERSNVEIEREGNKSGLREEDISFGDDPISILLLGIEDYSTNGQNGRADTIIIMTSDPNTNEINMVTVPRDTRVNIENAAEFSEINKINSAYALGSVTGYGDVKLQVETVEKLLDVPIDYYVAIDFNGFRDIVDALGGVTIDVKKAFWEENFYNNEKIQFEQGEQHLSGEEALAFVRMRKRPVNASYSRDERQRQFIKATIDQALSAGTLFKVGKISDILGENIKTDLSVNEIFDLQKIFSKSEGLSIQSIEIKGEDRYVGRGSYFIPEEESLKEVSEKLRNILNIETNRSFVTNADIVQ